MCAHIPTLRIACSGVVGEEYGSVASAGFEVLKELLRRGHQVDFFSKRNYVYPETLASHPGFRYHDCAQPTLDTAIERLRHDDARWLAGRIGNAVFSHEVMRAIADRHRQRPYDAQLFLGLWSYGRAPGLPVVSWVQGPPATDARSVVRHGASIRHLCGWSEYAKLRSYALLRSSRLGLPAFQHTDVVVCGSGVSRDTLVQKYGFPPATVRVLAYPIDLRTFRPAPAEDPTQSPEMLWIGRIVPRKRLDLFLDAGAQLIHSGVRLGLKVIGNYPFARGYHKLIEDFPFPDRLTYIAHLRREDLRLHMQRASVLVQPSEEENFGSSVAEALACGTPVVVGPSNGTGDYIGRGGQCFEKYSPAAVSETIGRILRLEKPALTGLRLAARAAALEHFEVSSVVDGLEAVLRSAIATSQRR